MVKPLTTIAISKDQKSRFNTQIIQKMIWIATTKTTEKPNHVIRRRRRKFIFPELIL